MTPQLLADTLPAPAAGEEEVLWDMLVSSPTSLLQAELKHAARALGLPVSGTKPQLIVRLLRAFGLTQPSAVPARLCMALHKEPNEALDPAMVACVRRLAWARQPAAMCALQQASVSRFRQELCKVVRSVAELEQLAAACARGMCPCCGMSKKRLFQLTLFRIMDADHKHIDHIATLNDVTLTKMGNLMPNKFCTVDKAVAGGLGYAHRDAASGPAQLPLPEGLLKMRLTTKEDTYKHEPWLAHLMALSQAGFDVKGKACWDERNSQAYKQKASEAVASPELSEASSSASSASSPAAQASPVVVSPPQHKPVRLTACRVEKLVTSLERIASVLSSLGAETREVNKAIKILLKPTSPATQNRKLSPSAYNLFIQRTMPIVRGEHPEASAKERMQLCAALWKKGKEEAAAAQAGVQSVIHPLYQQHQTHARNVVHGLAPNVATAAPTRLRQVAWHCQSSDLPDWHWVFTQLDSWMFFAHGNIELKWRDAISLECVSIRGVNAHLQLVLTEPGLMDWNSSDEEEANAEAMMARLSEDTALYARLLAEAVAAFRVSLHRRLRPQGDLQAVTAAMPLPLWARLRGVPEPPGHDPDHPEQVVVTLDDLTRVLMQQASNALHAARRHYLAPLAPA
ncbi:hypothetical protein COO60DRAFT_1465397 [Scenedesmus sp. NREL 46B-D3]|nr:hypothetical protein COO60DRAFT_1465397 [Scenedesmus sp. NREL 46B-D3]